MKTFVLISNSISEKIKASEVRKHYIHLSGHALYSKYDQLSGWNLRVLKILYIFCNISGLEFLAKNALAAKSGIVSKIDMPIFDRSPRKFDCAFTKDLKRRVRLIPERPRNLVIINVSFFPKLKKYLARARRISKNKINLLTKEENQKATKARLPLQMPFKLIRLRGKFQTFPIFRRKKNDFLVFRIANKTAFIIGDTNGLNYLIKALIYLMFYGKNDTDSHMDFRKTGENPDVNRFSYEGYFKNIDFAGIYRSEYYAKR